MSNEDKDEALYKYPGTDVLRNELDIRDPAALEKVERQLVAQRAREGIPSGRFDLKHLCDIHRHLFQDVYGWAGQVRQVDFHKGGAWFLEHVRIETGIADVHKRLSRQNYLKGLDADGFSKGAGVILGDINFAHPFREGNGRTQLQYLKQLAVQAGHKLDLRRISKERWIDASIQANKSEYDLMSNCIRDSITGPVRDQSRRRGREQDRGGRER